MESYTVIETVEDSFTWCRHDDTIIMKIIFYFDHHDCSYYNL